MGASFGDFVNKKSRETKRQLETLGKVLQKGGFEVENFIDESDPYVYVKNTEGDLSFEGVRLYKIGSNLAYRVQKESKTHPYGKAFDLDVEGMFEDLIGDMEEQEAGEEIIKAVRKEFKSFFDKNSKAEKEMDADKFNQGDPMGNVIVNAAGGDFTNSITNNLSN